jgi:hypothetical protein
MLVELKTRRARKREWKEAKREGRYPPIDERRILTYRQHHVANKVRFKKNKACHIHEFGDFCDNAFGKWFRV